MDNAIGELDDGPDAEPNLDPSQLLINVSLKDSIEPAGSRVAPIDVDNSHLPEPPVLEQAYGTELDSDPVSASVTHILEIIPDVEPDHLTRLVTNAVSTHGSGVLEHVLHILFEDSKYPKMDAKGKGKRKREDDEDKDAQAGGSKRPKVDFGYGDLSRAFKGGPDYLDLALARLQEDFPFLPKAYLRESLNSFDGRYAPTYISLAEQQEQYEVGKHSKRPVKLPYKRRKIAFRPINNGKNKELYDEEFEKERAWVVREVMDCDDECEGGIECGCCFASYRFQSMVQCPEAHLFCRTCMKSYAANLLGMDDPKINCIDQSGCAAPIPESELRRFLPDGMMKLWERVKQRKEIEAAGLVGLEECPFCDYAVIIEDAEDKLLRCGNLGVCGVVSCRTCKKSNHLPKTCDEVDSVLDGRHAVEEAMSQALFRNCPRCQKAFIKDGGCNHMTCPCGVTSCYICRQPMSNHTQPCIPPVSIKEARDQAVKEYIRDHPDVDGNQIQVSLSVRPLGKDRLKKP